MSGSDLEWGHCVPEGVLPRYVKPSVSKYNFDTFIYLIAIVAIGILNAVYYVN